MKVFEIIDKINTIDCARRDIGDWMDDRRENLSANDVTLLESVDDMLDELKNMLMHKDIK